MAGPARMVVLAPNWLGDAVMALPAVADVRRAWPQAHLAVAARANLAALFEAVPGVDTVVALEASPRAWAAGADIERLRAGGYDVALLLPNAFRAAWAAWRAGVRERWGYRHDLRGALLTRAIDPPTDPRLHQAAYYQHLTRALGIAAGPLQPVVGVPEAARAAATRLLDGAGWRGELLVGFAPGAAYGSAKRWLPERAGQLAARLSRELGARPVVVGAGADATTAAEVRSGAEAAGLPHGALIDVTGQTDLSTLIGVMSRCAAFVSNDSGAMHLAAALGVPVTAIFGPTREWATSPLAGPGHAPVVVHTDVSCRPCMKRTCPIDHRCMTRIEVEDVFVPVSRVLRDRDGRGAA